MPDHPPTYGWGQVPPDLVTRQQLADQGLRPGGPERGRLEWRRGKRVAGLYVLSDAVPKRPPTARQREALDRGRAAQAARRQVEEAARREAQEAERLAEEQEEEAQRQHDRDQAILWARKRLELGRAVILDTETTDLEGAYLVQVGILSLSGEVLFDTLVNPGVPIAEGATAVHGLGDKDVQGARPFREILPLLTRYLYGRAVIIYNARYDRGVLWRELRRHHEAQIRGELYNAAAWRAADAWMGIARWHCAMEKYAALVGEWSGYWGNYRYQPLPGGDHTAIGDCRATLALLHQMAASPLSTEGSTP